MVISFLGVDGHPSRGRESVAVLLESGSRRVLLDCGSSILQQLERAHVSPSEVDAVFVSHLHADHAGGLPSLLAGILIDRATGVAGEPRPLVICGGEETLRPLVALCRAAYPGLWRDGEGGAVRAIELRPGVRSDEVVQGFSFEPIRLEHTVPVTGARIEVHDVSLCFVPDSRYVPAVVEVARGAPLMICSVFGADHRRELANRFGFMSATEAAELARDAAVGALAMIHIGDVDERPVCVREASASFAGTVVCPSNGDRWELLAAGLHRRDSM
jgi:ribonuclease BN (tRNA processing enzyme)